MDIIQNNPYRVLGVLSNSPIKEAAANFSKIKAFSRTGKTLKFENDFDDILDSVDRSEESASEAMRAITLPKDKVAAGLFWFMEVTENDKEGLEYLREGEIGKAIEVLRKEPSVSACINLALINILIEHNSTSALYYYVYLINDKSKRAELLSLITDNPEYLPEEELVHIFVDTLLKSFPENLWIYDLHQKEVDLGDKKYDINDFFVKSNVYGYFSTKIVENGLVELKRLLEKAASIDALDAKGNLNIAIQIRDKYNSWSYAVEKVGNSNRKEYNLVSDETASQVLCNCINYYNHEENDRNKARKIRGLVRSTKDIAVSPTLKKRCSENYDIIKRECDALMPEEVQKEADDVQALISDFKTQQDNNPENVKFLDTLIYSLYQKILSVKTKLGEDNLHYYNLSSEVVRFSVNTIVEELNKKLNDYENANDSLKALKLIKLRMMLKWGNSIFVSLEKFAMNEDCKNHYAKSQTRFQKIFKNYSADALGVTATVQQYPDLTISNNAAKPVKRSPIINMADTIRVTQKTKKEHHQSTTSQRYHSPAYAVDVNNSSGFNNSNKDFWKILLLFLVSFVILLVVLYFAARYAQNQTRSSSVNNIENIDSSSNDTTIYEVIEEDKEVDYLHTNIQEKFPPITVPKNEESVKQADIIEETYTVVQYDTGDTPYAYFYGNGEYDYESLNTLLIKNGSTTDAVVFLENFDGEKCRHVYICKNKNFTMEYIPGGDYILKIYQGNDWNPERNNGSGNPEGGFMKNVSISKSKKNDSFDFPSSDTNRYGQWEITLYGVTNGNMQTQHININDLF